jgi:hypothetical protein
MPNTNELRNYAIQLSREVIALRKEIKALKKEKISRMEEVTNYLSQCEYGGCNDDDPCASCQIAYEIAHYGQ